MIFSSLDLQAYTEYTFTGQITVLNNTVSWTEPTVNPTLYHYLEYGGIKYPIISGIPGTAVLAYDVPDLGYTTVSMGYPKLSGQNPWNWTSDLDILEINKLGSGTEFVFAQEPRNNKLYEIHLANPVNLVAGLQSPPYSITGYCKGSQTLLVETKQNADKSMSLIFSAPMGYDPVLSGVDVQMVDYHKKEIKVYPSENGTLRVENLFDAYGNPVDNVDVDVVAAVTVEMFEFDDTTYEITNKLKFTLEDYINSRVAEWAQENL